MAATHDMAPSLPPRNPARLGKKSPRSNQVSVYLVSSSDAELRQASRTALVAASPPAKVPQLPSQRYDHMREWSKLKKDDNADPPEHWQIKHIRALRSYPSFVKDLLEEVQHGGNAAQAQPDSPPSLTRTRRDSAVALAQNTTCVGVSEPTKRNVDFWGGSHVEMTAWKIRLANQESTARPNPQAGQEIAQTPDDRSRRGSSMIRNIRNSLTKPVQHKLKRRNAYQALNVHF